MTYVISTSGCNSKERRPRQGTVKVRDLKRRTIAHARSGGRGVEGLAPFSISPGREVPIGCPFPKEMDAEPAWEPSGYGRA